MTRSPSESTDSDSLFRLAIEAAPTGMMLVDKAGAIVLVNAQVERLFGYSRNELIGMPMELLVPERFRKHHPGYRLSFFTAPQSRPMGAGRDLYGLCKDRTEVPIEIGLNPVTTADGNFVLSSIVDITERKRAAQQISASLQEKETLLREVHHRVKNNLQVISSLFSLQSRYLQHPEFDTMLKESQNRVLAIALVHERLYRANNLARVDFGEYLAALVQHLASAWTGDRSNIKVDICANNIELPVDLAVPCGLIVNELVTNAYKHAFPQASPGTIKIEASKNTDGATTLLVHDNGIGIPHHANLSRPKSLGLRLVTTLVRQLNGTLVTSGDAGTSMLITFQDHP